MDKCTYVFMYKFKPIFSCLCTQVPEHVHEQGHRHEQGLGHGHGLDMAWAW